MCNIAEEDHSKRWPAGFCCPLLSVDCMMHIPLATRARGVFTLQSAFGRQSVARQTAVVTDLSL